MCFSAVVSYSAAAILVPTGFYASRQASKLALPYWAMGLVPIFFGVQQCLEGRVWQLLETGRATSAIPFALGFHFFSHFLWLWWIPLASALVETAPARKRLFVGIALFGFLIGGAVYLALLLHPEWMSVQVEGRSIVYSVKSPHRGPIDLKIPPSALYALIILVPLFASSHAHVRRFGALIALSIVVASLAYGAAFVSVWCFFAAALSFYFVYMIRRLSSA